MSGRRRALVVGLGSLLVAGGAVVTLATARTGSLRLGGPETLGLFLAGVAGLHGLRRAVPVLLNADGGDDVLRKRSSFPYLGSRLVPRERVPCPACGREVRNVRGDFVGHWRRTCDAGGVTRWDLLRTRPLRALAGDLPAAVHRGVAPSGADASGSDDTGGDPASGGGESDGSAATAAAGDSTDDGWLATPPGQRDAVCPTCDERVENTREALVDHWSGPDCPGVTVRDLDDALAAGSAMPDSLTRSEITVDDGGDGSDSSGNTRVYDPGDG
jgi:endogenous inhibitor of DNA gyrase (YacG/DUF329 family)